MTTRVERRRTRRNQPQACGSCRLPGPGRMDRAGAQGGADPGDIGFQVRHGHVAARAATGRAAGPGRTATPRHSISSNPTSGEVLLDAAAVMARVWSPASDAGRAETPASGRGGRYDVVGGAAATQPTLTTTIDAANTTKPARPTWRAVKHRGTSSPWNDRPGPTAAAHRRPRRRRGVQRRATPDSPVGMGRSGMDWVVARVARQVRWGQGEAGQAEGRVS